MFKLVPDIVKYDNSHKKYHIITKIYNLTSIKPVKFAKLFLKRSIFKSFNILFIL